MLVYFYLLQKYYNNLTLWNGEIIIFYTIPQSNYVLSC